MINISSSSSFRMYSTCKIGAILGSNRVGGSGPEEVLRDRSCLSARAMDSSGSKENDVGQYGVRPDEVARSYHPPKDYSGQHNARSGGGDRTERAQRTRGVAEGCRC